ncbi:MAG TPA: M23 family metallopeptidase [Mucilaginibacter sp.]|jgi:murein DD-endopeptidase MepM/ murein hydrolase activator NlpD|nr:M23 family metallopeptidase [Mucilaginibacter sp.]
MGQALTLCCLFCLPLKHLSITSDFGYRIHPVTKQYAFHYGADFRAHGDTAYAIISGRAVAGYDPYLGINIKIFNDSFQIIYGHLSQILAIDSVQAGDPIGITGATGRVTGEHLHLSIKYHDNYIDPLKFLYALTIKSKSHE